jgi:hypothetical protein
MFTRVIRGQDGDAVSAAVRNHVTREATVLGRKPINAETVES